MDRASFDTCRLYYFSGTGNAKHVSEWMKSEADSLGIPTTLTAISELTDRRKPEMTSRALVGFIAPTHGFNFPPIMFHFILRFPRAKNNSAFIMNTRAGMKAGKIFLPGLSGLAQLFTALVLLFKGYRIVGMRPVDLPSNWISLHPGLKQNVIESLFKKRNAEVHQFAQTIFSGKKDYKALYDIVQDLIISPIAIGYYLIGRFIIAKSFVASSDCNRCGLCIKQCPIQAIKWVADRPFWTFNCESCMHCMNGCQKKAIETAHGYIALVIFIINSFIFVWLYRNLSLEAFFAQHFNKFGIEILTFVVDGTVYLGMFFISYRVLHFFMRYRWFNKLVVYTSFTHYKFWRRYVYGLHAHK